MEDYENRPAFDLVSLQEKLIEPDSKNNYLQNRNWQMGNIKSRFWEFLNHKIQFNFKLINYPLEEGGWLTSAVGKENLDAIELQMIASNSIGGFARQTFITRKQEQTLRDESQKSGLFSSFIRRN